MLTALQSFARTTTRCTLDGCLKLLPRTASVLSSPSLDQRGISTVCSCPPRSTPTLVRGLSPSSVSGVYRATVTSTASEESGGCNGLKSPRGHALVACLNTIHYTTKAADINRRNNIPSPPHSIPTLYTHSTRPLHPSTLSSVSVPAVIIVIVLVIVLHRLYVPEPSLHRVLQHTRQRGRLFSIEAAHVGQCIVRLWPCHLL